jgi:hypothetical protein
MSMTRYIWILAPLLFFVTIRYRAILSSFAINGASTTLNSSNKKPTIITSSSNTVFNSAITLVFIIGVEGVGHHLISQLLKDSPNMRALNELGLIDADNPIIHVRLMDGRRMDSSLFDKAVSGMIKLNQVVSDHVKEQQEAHSPFHIAVNTNGYSRFQSYPQARRVNDNDRVPNTPNIDIFYNACKKAQVDCKHIYLYRDPYDVIASTTVNRNFNVNARSAIRTYTLMTHFIYSQLSNHIDKTLLCFGPLDVNGYKRQTDWDKFGKIFGWKTTDDFRAYINAINMKHDISTRSESEKVALVPETLSVHMEAYMQIHERATNLCYSHAQ